MRYYLFASILFSSVLPLSSQNALIDLFHPFYQNLVPLQTDSLFIRNLDTYQGPITRAIGYKYADDGINIVGWQETRRELESLRIWTIVQSNTLQDNGLVIETETTDSLSNRKFKDRQTHAGTLAAQPDSIVYELWDSIEWVPNQKTLLTYTGNGQTESRKEQRWNAEAADWVNEYQQTWKYDDQNRLLQRRNESWKEVEWRTTNEYYYTYNDGESQPGSIVWYSSDNADGTLNPVDSMAIWYDGEGRIDSNTAFLWNPYSSGWFETSRVSLTNEAEKKGNEGQAFVKGEDGSWVAKEEAVYTPSEQLFTDEPQEILIKVYDPKTEEWKEKRRKVINYQPIDGGRVYGSIQIWEINDSLQDWQEVFFAEAWLRILPSGLEQDSVEDRSRKFTILYSCELPNPYVRNRTLVFPANEATGDYELQIFSAEGRMVYRKKYDESGIGYVDAPLQPGVYMASVSRGGTPLCTQKLIVQ